MMTWPLQHNGPFDPEAFVRGLQGEDHNTLVGCQYRAHGPDWVELAIPYNADLTDRDGSMETGPIATLMDMACGMAIWMKVGFFRRHATSNMRIDCLRPAIPGRTILGLANCFRLEQEIAFAEGVAHDGDVDDPVARITATFMFTE